MFIKRNHTAIAGKPYQSVLLVQGKRVPGKRGPGRPKAGEPPPPSVVVHETLANLSKLPQELIGLIEAYCKGTAQPPSAPPGPPDRPAAQPPPVHQGPCYGVLAALHALATELGIVAAVGQTTRTARLALYLVYARLFHQGSRLSAARASEDHAVREVLNVGRFDENDLYEALDYLEVQQPAIEDQLHAHRPSQAGQAIFLYDVTSHYFEGQDNELAAYGYTRGTSKRARSRSWRACSPTGRASPFRSNSIRATRATRPRFWTRWKRSRCALGPRKWRWWGTGA